MKTSGIQGLCYMSCLWWKTEHYHTIQRVFNLAILANSPLSNFKNIHDPQPQSGIRAQGRGHVPEEREHLQADPCARIMLLYWSYATHLLRCIVLTAEKLSLHTSKRTYTPLCHMEAVLYGRTAIRMAGLVSVLQGKTHCSAGVFTDDEDLH